MVKHMVWRPYVSLGHFVGGGDLTGRLTAPVVTTTPITFISDSIQTVDVPVQVVLENERHHCSTFDVHVVLCHRTHFRDSFCLASVFEMWLFTYLLTYLCVLCWALFSTTLWNLTYLTGYAFNLVPCDTLLLVQCILPNQRYQIAKWWVSCTM